MSPAQAAYEVNKWLRISIEGSNLTDATQEYTLGNNDIKLPQGYYRYGRSITVGASRSRRIGRLMWSSPGTSM